MNFMPKRTNFLRLISSCPLIRTLQGKVNPLNEGEEFFDPQMINRDSGLPHSTRNSMGTSRNVFWKPTCSRISPSLPGIAVKHGIDVALSST